MAVDCVVKIGGSLIKKRAAVDLINSLTSLDEDILIVPGGGKLADAIRAFDEDYSLSDRTSHWTAIECMDINARLLQDVTEKTESIDSLDQIGEVIDDKRIPIFQSRKFLSTQDRPETWELTSDSISAIVAGELDTELVICTDVDGIMDGALVESLDLEDSERYKGTCIDERLPSILKEYETTCVIVSGLEKERVRKAVKREPVKGTNIR